MRSNVFYRRISNGPCRICNLHPFRDGNHSGGVSRITAPERRRADTNVSIEGGTGIAQGSRNASETGVTYRDMESEHTPEAIRRRFAPGPRRSYLRDWLYGGIDGIVTTFAIVFGVVGARLSPHIILILGSASLIADGFAMTAGDYLATRSEDEEFHHAEAIERRHIEGCPEGEREEVREILRRRGIPGELLDPAVAAITADPDLWVRMMLRDEYGLPEAVRSPGRAAFMTFSAFLICGLVPLLPFVAEWKNAFSTASVVSD